MSSQVSKAEKKKREAQSARDKMLRAGVTTLVRNISQPAPSKPKNMRVPSHPYIDLAMDPFTAESTGLPDLFTGPTAVNKLRDTLVLTTNSSGQGAVIINPNLASFVYTGTYTANVISSWGTPAAHEKYSTINTEASALRIVAQAVRISYTGAPLSATGRIVIMPVYGLGTSEISTSPLDWFDAGNALEAMPADLPAEHHMIPFADQPFVSITTSQYRSFPSILVAIYGGVASTAVLSIEVVTHIEMLPFSTTLSANAATSSPAHPIVLAAVANAIGSSAPHPAEHSDKHKFAWNQAIRNTFAAMGAVGEAAGVPFAGLLPAVPAVAKRVMKGIRGFLT